MGINQRDERGESEESTLTVYRQRWAVLATVTFLIISNSGLWINTAPVSYKAADYFGVSLWAINWFSLVFLMVPIPMSFFSTFSINKFGLQAAVRIGSCFNCLGAITRAVSTSGLVPSAAQFPLSLTGQVIAAMASPFLVYIPTKVSQLWFPEQSRALSTTVLSLAPPIGVLITQLTSPLIVSTSDQLPTLNYIFCGVAVLAFLVTIVFVTRSKPPTPPSLSAARGEDERPPYLQQLKETFTCVPYLLLLITLGCGIGIFSSLASVSQQILCPMGYNEVFSGLTMAMMILFGFVGSGVTGLLAGRTQSFTPITKLFYGVAGIFIIIMSEMFLVPGQPALILISVSIFGFFGVGAFPVGLELAVEATYPVEESISTSFIYIIAQILATLVMTMITQLSRELSQRYSDIEVCTLGLDTNLQPRDYTVSMMALMILVGLVSSMFILLFETRYKRLEAERSLSPPHSFGRATDSIARNESSPQKDSIMQSTD